MAQMVKNLPVQCRRPGFDPWVRKIPWRREQLPIPVFLPGEFHGQRSLAGYSPWGRKEADTTEWLAHTFLICEYPDLEDYKAFRFPNLALDNIYIL